MGRGVLLVVPPMLPFHERPLVAPITGRTEKYYWGLAVGISALRWFSEVHPATVFSRDRRSLARIGYSVLVLINAIQYLQFIQRDMLAE